MRDRSASKRRKARFIVELQFPIIPQFLDHRGRIIGNVHQHILPRFRDWDSSPEHILFTDNRTEPTAEVLLAAKRLSVILEDPASLQVFLDLTDNVLKHAYKELGGWIKTLSRVGMRLVSVAESPHPTYDETLAAMLARFHRTPTTLPLKVTDSQSVIVHEYGQYAIGPTKTGDAWVRALFKKPDRQMPDVGVAIDIDSYGKDVAVGSLADVKAAVNSVMSMTLAIEEDLHQAFSATHG